MPAIPKPRPGGIGRFGKRPAKRDDRNLTFAAILRPPVPLPTKYDFNVKHKGIRTPMFGKIEATRFPSPSPGGKSACSLQELAARFVGPLVMSIHLRPPMDT